LLSEEKKEQDKQWKRMKLGFYVFGVGMGGMGGWTLYDMGQPERDGEGQIIEDEYSNLPTLEQYKCRILKNLNYYQKVA
jgi:import inner membrane translocase subunit TIM50